MKLMWIVMAIVAFIGATIRLLSAGGGDAILLVVLGNTCLILAELKGR